MGVGPQYRAVLCKAVVSLLRERDVGRRALERVDSEILERIDKAGSLRWLASSDLDRINGAVLQTGGRDAYVDFWRHYTVAASDSALFGRLFEGAVRIFGLRPGGLLGWYGRAWEATTRNYGRVDCTRSTETGSIVMKDLPEIGRLDTVALSLEGSAVGILELTNHNGETRLDTSRLESAGEIRLEVDWVATSARASR